MAKYSVADIQIDVADIWIFEQARLKNESAKGFVFDELRSSLIPFYILKKHEPFASRAAAQDDPEHSAYYNNYNRRLLHDHPSVIDYFKYREGFYDMNESCIIEQKDVIVELYAWLFSLKLRQLEGRDEQLDDF